jgi:hypothetical protein
MRALSTLSTTFLLTLLLSSTAAHAQAPARTLCVFDPAGRAGDYFGLLQRFATAASAWGVSLTVKPYTDEETAAKDYLAGVCDGVAATGIRLQQHNRFSATLEAIGALPEYSDLQQMVTTLSTSPSAASKLSNAQHSVVGVLPVGAVYLLVRDRSVDSVPELAGKRIATMDYDKASTTMVSRVGAVVVPVDLSTLAPRFNNGDVDACYVSAPAFQPFELARGLGTKGGILKAPLAQATMQVMVHPAQFPSTFAASARTWFAAHFNDALALVTRAEQKIPAKYWVSVDDTTQKAWATLFQSVRVQVRDAGGYDGSMLSVMRKVRCAKNAARAECAEAKE